MKKKENNLYNRWFIMAIVLTSLYFIYFSFLSLLRHWSFDTYYYDLGIMHQVIFNTAHGLFFQMTNPTGTQQISRLSIHFDPLMLIFVPIYWIFPKAEVLLVGQTLFLASGSVPVYFLTQKMLKRVKDISLPLLGFLFSFLYLNYFPMQKTNLFDFHAVTLATALFLWAFYFIEENNYKWALLLLGTSLFGKENIALITFMTGLYVFFLKKKRKMGLFISLGSLVFFAVVMGIIIPMHRTNLHFAESYYSLNAKANIVRLFSMSSLNYVFQLLQPLGFISLFGSVYILLAIPEWMINLLSKNVNMRVLDYHYTALLTPFVIMSAIVGFGKIYDLLKVHFQKFSSKKIVYFLCTLVLVFNFYTAIQTRTFVSFSPVNKAQLSFIQKLSNDLQDASIPISSSGRLAPYFSGRKYFYNFLFDFAYETMNLSDKDVKSMVNRYEKADYVILQKEEIGVKHSLVIYYYNHLKNNKKYVQIFDREGIEVYHKVGAPSVFLGNI